MKGKILLIAGLMFAAGMQAQTSPWTGNELPEEGGTFYLYQVETGKWLQNNNRVAEDWTTRAQLDKYGFDVKIIKLPDGGYQLDPRFGHNHSINGHNFYLDTNDALTKWNIVPTTLNGVTNTYVIYTDDEHYLNANDEGFLDDFGFNQNWQLVTYEQRMEDLKTATRENPKDATWLIGGHDFANQDERNNWDIIQEGDGVYAQGGDGIVHGNRAVECWKKTNFKLSKTITGLPNGTYQFQLQGFYRDGPEVNIGNKREAGEEVIRASYFINDVTRFFKSILDSGVTEEDLDSYAVSQGGVYIPGNSVPGNALDRASNCFFKDGYWNDPVEVVVSDGTLSIGMQKIGGGDDDWLVFDSFTLTYLGSEIDLGPVKANLLAAITDAEAYEGLPVAILTEALASAKQLVESTDATAISNATMVLRNALTAAQLYSNLMKEANDFDGVKADFFNDAVSVAQTAASQETSLEAFNEVLNKLQNAINDVRGIQDPLKFIAATIPFAQAAGVEASIIERAQALLEHCDAAYKVHDALNDLRIARKIKAADKHADVFEGKTPGEGDYYIYNVGLERFLCGGGDWGAHAYVGFPGVKVTLIAGSEFPENADMYEGFKIDTHLSNGEGNEYLNYGGYMDTGHQNLWEFVAIEGKPGVYAIARANGEKNPDTGERMLLGWRPGTYGNIDTDMYSTNDENNQWKLVTEEERDALLATATTKAPQDASYKIVSPNFNQRDDVSSWISQYGTGGIWGRNGNYNDFAFECWNSSDFDFSQNVYDLLPGWYGITVQGYYRDGSHEDQIRVESSGQERVQAASLVDFMTQAQIQLPNILSEIDKAPGMGDRRTTRYLIDEVDADGNPVYQEDGTIRQILDPNGEDLYVGEFPYNIPQACDYFQNGLYKTSMLVEVGNTGDLMILVQKFREQPNDWVVLDNFRLTYYGTQKPSEEETGVKTFKAEENTSAKIYNILGQQVKNVTKGIYIRDGKKFIKK